MKSVLGNAWRFTILIIILFAIVAVAARSIITFFEDQIPELASEDLGTYVSVAVWTLTMGCMCIAGALGMLAIRSSAEIEGKRRIGRFVELMDYLNDGLCALEKSGLVTGMNPTARKLSPRVIPSGGQKVHVRDIYDCLTPEDIRDLIQKPGPHEVERDCVYPHGLRRLRFRSQASAGVRLVLVSDVTDMHSRELREQQSAQLQLVGRIAGGVAHDFNNILCAISGHASLLQRKGMDPESAARSIEIIVNETQRGSQLSRQLLELSRSGATEGPGETIQDSVNEAVELLRVGLSPTWTVNVTVDERLSAVSLAPRQVVQVVLNLGLLAADSLNRPGTISVTLCRPGEAQLAGTDKRYHVAIVVSAEPGSANGRHEAHLLSGEDMIPIVDESGVIVSVVRSLVEQAGGRFDHLSGPDRVCIYRVCLPHVDAPVQRREDQEGTGAIKEVGAYVSHWKVVVACPGGEMDVLKEELRGLGTEIRETSDIVSLLSDLEQFEGVDAMVVYRGMLGDQAAGLMRAIVKLCPGVGLVVVGDSAQAEPPEAPFDIMYETTASSHDRIVRSMVEAKALAATRKTEVEG